jgi:uncharacterized protein
MHMKLGALLDLVDLYHHDPKGRYHAPWRLDPRPVGALLQGVYAHAGVTDYWRVRRRASGTTRLADVEFAYWREQNRVAVRTLAESGELTPLGDRFVAGLRATLGRWQREAVSPTVAAGVAAMVLAQTVRWRLHNWDPGEVEPRRLAEAWRAGRPPGQVDSVAPLRAGEPAGPAGIPGLVGLIRGKLVHGGTADGMTQPADAALLDGDHERAVRGYLERLDRDAADDDTWVGLAVALDTAAPTSLRHRPDLVRAIFRILREKGEPPHAVALAGWLDQGL